MAFDCSHCSCTDFRNACITQQRILRSGPLPHQPTYNVTWVLPCQPQVSVESDYKHHCLRVFSAAHSLADTTCAGPPPQLTAPAFNGNYSNPPADPGFQQGYAEGLRMAQQQLAQQHLQQMPFQQQSFQQYWHPQQPPAPGFMGGPPPAYNPAIMPASPAMGPPPGWQPYGQQQQPPQPQQVTGQAAAFFRGRGRGRRGGRA